MQRWKLRGLLGSSSKAGSGAGDGESQPSQGVHAGPRSASSGKLVSAGQRTQRTAPADTASSAPAGRKLRPWEEEPASQPSCSRGSRAGTAKVTVEETPQNTQARRPLCCVPSKDLRPCGSLQTVQNAKIPNAKITGPTQAALR